MRQSHYYHDTAQRLWLWMKQLEERSGASCVDASTTPLPNNLPPLHFLVSACLLRHPVSYRGLSVRLGALHPLCIMDRAARQVRPIISLIPICPEMAIGLGSPRPPVMLRGPPGAVELTTTTTNVVITPRVTSLVEELLAAPSGLVDPTVAARGLPPSPPSLGAGSSVRVVGFIGKARSPSCGVGDAKVFGAPPTTAHHRHDGCFTGQLRHRCSEDSAFPCVTERALGKCDGAVVDFLSRALEWSDRGAATTSDAS